MRENRALYREKFDAVLAVLGGMVEVERPAGGFYLWPRVPFDDAAFTHDLYSRTGVTVLPGSYLSREYNGINPGSHRVRIALVAPLDDCVIAAERIRQFLTDY